MNRVANLPTIAIFGATGRTGHHVLEQATAAGHAVRVLARRAGALELHPEQATVVTGNVLDPAAVAETIRGADVVVSVFGHVKGSPPTLQADGTQIIVNAMAHEGISRIISLSGGGLAAPQDEPKVTDRFIRFLLRRLSPHVLDDAIAHLEVLRASGLDWTVVRGPRLTDNAPLGTYRVGWVGVNASTQIARGDLARFILTLVADRGFVHQLPFVSR